MVSFSPLVLSLASSSTSFVLHFCSPSLHSYPFTLIWPINKPQNILFSHVSAYSNSQVRLAPSLPAFQSHVFPAIMGVGNLQNSWIMLKSIYSHSILIFLCLIFYSCLYFFLTGLLYITHSHFCEKSGYVN